VTLTADMDGDVVGELGLDTVVDMDGESAGDVAVRLWMLTGYTTVNVDIGGRWEKWMMTRVGDMDGDARGKTQQERCL